MSDAPVIIPSDATRFFDDYLECLHKASIPEKQRRWYVKRVETFIKAQNGRRIKTLSGADIAGYFEAIGRQNRLPGWQFRQCIDAIGFSIAISCQPVPPGRLTGATGSIRQPGAQCTGIPLQTGACPRAGRT